MPRGVPLKGFRRTGKYKARSLQELEQDIASKAVVFVAELEKYIKPFPCPHCGNTIKVVDKEVAMYMVDRALGKPKQKHEVDVAETIQLTADQIDRILESHIWSFMTLIAERHLGAFVAKYQLAIRGLLPQGEVLEGEVKELPGPD